MEVWIRSQVRQAVLARFLRFEPSLQVGERLMRCRWRVGGAGYVRFPAVLAQKALVLVFVTVGAQKLPVAPIGRVVVVIVVAMMNFQQLQVGVGEFSATAPAYPGVEFEC